MTSLSNSLLFELVTNRYHINDPTLAAFALCNHSTLYLVEPVLHERYLWYDLKCLYVQKFNPSLWPPTEEDMYRYSYQLMLSAAFYGNFDLFKWIEEKWPSYLQSSNYHHLLLNAVTSGNLELVQWMVEEKWPDAYENIDNYSYGVLKCAVESGNLNLVKWIVKKLSITPDTLLLDPVGSLLEFVKNLELLKWLMENVITNLGDYQCHSLVWFAARDGNFEIVKWLIKTKFKYTPAQVYDPCYRLLGHAILSGNFEMVKWFVENWPPRLKDFGFNYFFNGYFLNLGRNSNIRQYLQQIKSELENALVV